MSRVINISTESSYHGDNINYENKTVHNAIKVSNLSFSYNKTEEILKGINMTVGQDEHVILLGESGSGKSTLIKCIAGFLPDFNGDIEVNGVHVSVNNQSQIIKYISYVPQSPYMFKRTIAENIAMCFSDSNDIDKNTMARVIDSAKKAQAHKFIEQLPNQYNTKIDDIMLSGGQVQRIATCFKCL